MSNRKPHRSCFFSSSSSSAAAAAPPGTCTPTALAVQPPADPVPLSGSSRHLSVAPEERVIHPFPCSSTPKIPIHKLSHPTLQDPKHTELEPLTEKPSTCTAPENLTRLLPEDSCNTLQPPTHKPLPKKHPTHKLSHDPGHGVALGSRRRSSSHDQPRNRMHKPAADTPSAHTLKDPEHPNQDGSCSTLPPVTYKPSKKTHPNHKVCEDPDQPGLRSTPKDDPPRSIPDRR